MVHILKQVVKSQPGDQYHLKTMYSLNQIGGQEDNPSSLCCTTKVELDNAAIKTKGLRLPNCEKRESIKLGLDFPYGSKKGSVVLAAGLQRWYTEVDPCWHIACIASKETEHQMASLTGTTHCSECWLARYRLRAGWGQVLPEVPAQQCSSSFRLKSKTETDKVKVVGGWKT